jgi:hypothetical protein
VLGLLLGLALSGVVAPARAQSSDAGPAPEGEAHTTAATDPSAEAPAQAPAAPTAAEPAANNSGFPKMLSPQQRLPENLQSWMRERNRRRPAVVERPLSAPASLAPQLAEDPARQREVIEGYKRRLRSFDEGGVTVLSNRHAAPAPEPPVQPVAATAAIAVAATVPAPPLEEDPEPEPIHITETHSLRAKQKPKAPVPDQGVGWPAFAVSIAAIGLGLIWLQRRRQPHQ